MRAPVRPAVLCTILGVSAAVLLAGADPAAAAQPTVGLGVATSFAVLAGSTITNTGPSVITGDVGLSPGTAVPGLNSLPGPATVHGTEHIHDGVAATAERDLTLAYTDAARRTPVHSARADLAGQTLVAGVYAGPTLGLTGTVTLDAKGDPAAVFVFKAASTLITASSSVVSLINGANPCNVYWQVGSSATLGTNSTFVGSVLALTSISATTGATVEGRLLARNAAVTLDDNTITRPSCTTTTPSPGPSSSSATPRPRPTSSGAGAPGRPLRSPSAAGSTTPPGGGTTTPPGGGTTPPAQPPRLARTGSDTASLSALGAGAVLLGGLLLLVARRRVAGPRHGR